jgi:hypothetical protein
MTKKSRPRRRGDVGRVSDVRFVEVAFEAPVGTRMVIELEGGLRLLLADERAVPLAAAMLDALAANRSRKGGRQ